MRLLGKQEERSTRLRDDRFLVGTDFGELNKATEIPSVDEDG